MRGQGSRGATTPLEPILPDGRTEIIVHRAEPFAELGTDGRLRRQEPLLVTGQGTRPVLLQPSTEVRVLGVRLLPGAAARFLRPPLHELTDRIMPMREVALGAFTRGFEECAVRVASDADAVASVAAHLRTVFEPRRATPVDLATRLVAEGIMSVEALARAVERSTRQVERLFLDEVGVSPGMLIRIRRFARAVAALNGAEGHGVGLALDFGYYDQSHMIREVRRFSDVTPGQLASRLVGLTGVFASPGPMSDSSNPSGADCA